MSVGPARQVRDAVDALDRSAAQRRVWRSSGPSWRAASWTAITWRTRPGRTCAGAWAEPPRRAVPTGALELAKKEPERRLAELPG